MNIEEIQERLLEAKGARLCAVNSHARARALARENFYRAKLEEAEGKSDGMQGGGDMKRCPSCNWRNKIGTKDCKKCKGKLRKDGDKKIEEADLTDLIGAVESHELTEADHRTIITFFTERQWEELTENDDLSEAFDSRASLDRSPKKNWVENASSSGLPMYIRRIANHVHAKGKPIGHSIAIAINMVKKMCSSGDVSLPGVQQVNAKSRAEACKAVAEWTALKAKNKAKSAAKG